MQALVHIEMNIGKAQIQIAESEPLRYNFAPLTDS
jgi:hypothetical protein